MMASGITRIIGLMSGTSHDGVDAALVEITTSPAPALFPPHPSLSPGGRGVRRGGPEIIRLLHHLHVPYSKSLRDEIRQAFTGDTGLICRLNFRLGEVFAGSVLSLLEQTGLRPGDISAVASHGQTLCHIPPLSKSNPAVSSSGKGGLKTPGRMGATLQIGEAAVIAERTGILTISDFRTADMAAGGQGAPLVPMADYFLFNRKGKVRALLNIGGIANVTVVRERMEETVAFDTGPGNSLIDEAMRLSSAGKRSYDKDGSFARGGMPIKKLLDELLSHPYFRKRPPKSTGRETFGEGMVRNIFLRYRGTRSRDIVATLTHLTAMTIHDATVKFRPDEIILSGGGVKNRFLVELMKGMFTEEGITVNNISAYGIPPEAREAMSFAILGYQILNRRPGNIPSATGARHEAILGKIALPIIFG